MFKAGWRRDDAIQSSGSFHSVANPWFQINSTEYRKAQLRCITVVRLSCFSLQNCRSRFEHYSLKHWTGLLTLVFIFSLPLVSSQDRPHFVFLFLKPQGHSSIGFFYWIYPNIGREVSRYKPFSSPLWLWDRIAMKGLCLVRSACPVPSCTCLTYPRLLGMHGHGMEEPGLPMEELVGTQGPGQTSTAARATVCYLLVLCNLGICANLKRSSRRLYSYSTRI